MAVKPTQSREEWLASLPEMSDDPEANVVIMHGEPKDDSSEDDEEA